jgi:hypothetical protein
MPPDKRLTPRNNPSHSTSLVAYSFATLPSTTSISVEFTHATRKTRPDGSILETLHTNPDRVVCTSCSTPFRNQAQLNEHHRAFYWPCQICQRYEYWCRGGAEGYARIPYCRYACVEHGLCFQTGDEAQDHGARVNHNKCFYPRCVDELARGSADAYWVYWHVKNDHCQGRE